jgi:hypothetical protein
MARLRKTLESVDRSFISIVLDFFFGYKPEKHYMRGPGPKWYEKHSSSR